jgi:hypothetical protein
MPCQSVFLAKLALLACRDSDRKVAVTKPATVLYFAMALAGACGGREFTSSAAEGGAGGHLAEGGVANNDTAGASSEAGGASQSVDSGGEGFAGSPTDPMGSAGAGQAGGSGGSVNAPTCQQLNGFVYEQHCYVDATVESFTQPQAEEACANVAREAERPGHLLVLDTVAEQSFILKQFLAAFTDKSDAWLALTCSETEQPDFAACHCGNSCGADALLVVRKVWKWVDESSATFGWVLTNPNGGGRCSALGYNPATLAWGWVDRNCAKNSFQQSSGMYPAHSYRTLCELE